MQWDATMPSSAHAAAATTTTTTTTGRSSSTLEAVGTSAAQPHMQLPAVLLGTLSRT